MNGNGITIAEVATAGRVLSSAIQSHVALVLSRHRHPPLLGAPAREDHPAVECGGPAFAAAACSNSDRIGGSFDNVAQANVFIADKPRKPDSVRLTCILVRTVMC
jgi:hypothetical protein